MPAHGLSHRSLWFVCLMALILLNLTHRGDARPNYKKAFDDTYPDVIKKEKKTNCLVCHASDEDKKKRNHYGEALRKELKEPMVKDEKKIKDALKAIEDGECKSGKWKERLDEGKTPCICGNRDHESSSYIARQLARDRHADQ